jgi:hydrogenase-4 component F
MAKSLGFFTVGRLGQLYGTHDMARMSGALRAHSLWGGAFLASILALLGAAPFSLFLSELLILKAAADARATVTMVLYLAGLGVVFVGALRHAIDVALGETPASAKVERLRGADVAIVVAQLSALLILGLWMPAWFRGALEQAATVVGGGR